MAAFRCTIATSTADLDAVYRLRYRIYVEQMGLLAPDHPYCRAGRLVDPYDAYSHQVALWFGDRLVGTIRVTTGAEGPLEIEACRPIDDHVDRQQAAEYTRFMVDRPFRCPEATGRLLAEAFLLADRLGARFMVGAGKLGSLGQYYRRIGLRCVDPEPFEYPVVPGAQYQLLVADVGARRSLRRWLWRLYAVVGRAVFCAAPALTNLWHRRDLSAASRRRLRPELAADG